MLKDLKVALIGAGRMGGALLKGIINSGKLAPADIVISEPKPERADELQHGFGVRIAEDNLTAVEIAAGR